MRAPQLYLLTIWKMTAVSILTGEALLHELDSNLRDEDISNWLNVDAVEHGYQLLSDNEIIQQLTSQLAA